MTFMMIESYPTTDAEFDSSNVAETETGKAAWNSGTTYALGAYCVSLVTHKVYQSLQAGNLNKDPTLAANTHDGDPAKSPAGLWWVVVQPTRRWRPFDRSQLYTTEDTVDIRWAVYPQNRINAVALFGLKGVTVRLEILNATGTTVLQTYTRNILGSGLMGVPGWVNQASRGELIPDCVFLDVTHQFPQGVRVTVEGSGTAPRAVSEIAMGQAILLGEALQGTGVGYRDRSTKEEDYFGQRRIVKRPAADTGRFNVKVAAKEVDRVVRLLKAQRTNPCVFLTLNSDTLGTMVFGYPADPLISHDASPMATYTLDVDGA